jgi:arylsulfatase A-like enzyme
MTKPPLFSILFLVFIIQVVGVFGADNSEGSRPQFTSISVNEATSEIHLAWTIAENSNYLLEKSSDLITWSSVDVLSGNTHAVTPTENKSEQVFFRISSVSTAAPNNILLLIVDDWGIDSSPIDNLNGTNLPVMPHLESLAATGIRFSNAYALPMCSPTRASILTGRYPFRHGVGSPAGANLPSSELTLAEAMSAHTEFALGSVGKWHLGGGNTGPRDTGGWPYFAGSLGSGVEDYSNWQKIITIGDEPPQSIVSSTYATTDTTNDAISWIQDQADQPWFCWVAYNAAHSPFHDPPSTISGKENPFAGARGNRNRFEAMLWAMDSEIGRLIDTIDRSTTEIILIGDNGTPGGVIQPPFTREHSKGTLYDGGTHVPLVINGPSVLRPNTISDQLVHCADLFPTIIELSGVKPESLNLQLDGISLLPILSGESLENRPIVCEAFGRNFDQPGRAIRKDDYKLIIFDDPNSDTDTARLEFYQLSSDSNETNNLLSNALSLEQQTAFDELVAYSKSLGGNFNQ